MATFSAKHIALVASRVEELAKFGKRTLPGSIKQLYVEFLAPLTPEELDIAFKGWIFKSTRFPSAEELLACCGRSPTQKAESNWLTLETKRDQIADEVCRQHQILNSLRLCAHGSEYEAGVTRRELKARFCKLYEIEWFKWWTAGNIQAGETILDFSPKPTVTQAIGPEERLSDEDVKFLKKRIRDMAKGKAMGMGKDKKITPLTPEEIKKIESELEDPKEDDEPESPDSQSDPKDFDDLIF